MRDYKSAGAGARSGLDSQRSAPKMRRVLLAVAIVVLALGLAAALLLRHTDPGQEQAEMAQSGMGSPEAIPLTLPPPSLPRTTPSDQ